MSDGHAHITCNPPNNIVRRISRNHSSKFTARFIENEVLRKSVQLQNEFLSLLIQTPQTFLKINADVPVDPLSELTPLPQHASAWFVLDDGAPQSPQKNIKSHAYQTQQPNMSNDKQNHTETAIMEEQDVGTLYLP